MTRIDFHTHVAEKLLFTCRLIRKARTDNHKIVVFCADDAQLQALDEALWNFSAQDFLPHVRATDPLAAQTPILLSVNADEELVEHQVLINLAHHSPAHFARFERLVEIVSTDEADVIAGRERFAYYRQRGYPLTHYNRSKNEQPAT